MNIIRQILEAKAATAVEPWPEMAGKPYRPGSGTEGMAFDEAWCAHCARDTEWRASGPDFDRAEGCRIIADSFAYEVTDPRYPKEWVHDRDGRPRCTAFTTDPKNPVRCDKTADMFESSFPSGERQT